MKYLCVCGTNSSITYGNFSVGKRCYKCGYQKTKSKLRHNQETVQKIFKGHGCILLDQYINNYTPMSYICKCGRKSKINFDNFKRGKRCKECRREKRLGTSKYTHAEVEKYFFDHQCILLDTYTNASTLLKYICSCGHQSLVSYTQFKGGRRCRYCRQSKGERLIESVLQTMGCTFVRQYKNPACKNKRSLPFDFAIMNNNSIKIIEYQGKQHYEPLSFGSKGDIANINFQYIKHNDDIKKRWCERNHIEFLEIPYWKYRNIEKIVMSFVEK
jgi:hypothetical protein